MEKNLTIMVEKLLLKKYLFVSVTLSRGYKGTVSAVATVGGAPGPICAAANFEANTVTADISHCTPTNDFFRNFLRHQREKGSHASKLRNVGSNGVEQT